MGYLTKDQILNANDLQKKKVNVPEWGGDLYVYEFDGSDRDKLEAFIASKKVDSQYSTEKYRSKVLSLSLKDDSGNFLFSDGDLEDLNKKSSQVINRLFDIAQELNGLGEESVEAASGKSGTGQNAGSGTD